METGPVGLGEECGTEAWHGKAKGYRELKCKGDACQKWNSDRQARARRKKDDGIKKNTSEHKDKMPGQGALEIGRRRVVPGKGELVSACWCGKNFVPVPISDIKCGLTRCCKHKACKPLDTASVA